ncbi:MAG: DUF997 family protein [Pirellulales bacterium]
MFLHAEGSGLADREHPVLKSARREAAISLGVWLVALIYTVGYCVTWGYGRPVEEIEYVWGFPDWIFWGIVVPWVVAAGITTVFAYTVVSTEPFDDDAADPQVS